MQGSGVSPERCGGFYRSHHFFKEVSNEAMQHIKILALLGSLGEGDNEGE